MHITHAHTPHQGARGQLANQTNLNAQKQFLQTALELMDILCVTYVGREAVVQIGCSKTETAGTGIAYST